MEYFPCEVCHEPFKQKHLLQRHMDGEHSGKKPFQCTGCGKKYSRKDNARQHMKRHCPGFEVVKVAANDESPAIYSSITVGIPQALRSTDAGE